MNTSRRHLLRLSPLAIAASAITIGRSASAESPAPTAADATFNVRTYGATGDGKTVDTQAINRANFALRNVSELRIFWARAAKDTTLDHVENQNI